MSGDLKWNKILGAGLATVFVILVVREVSTRIYDVEAPEKMGYFIDAPLEAEGGAAEVELPPDWGTVLPIADVSTGETAFRKCTACHTAESGGANGIGPNLFGVVGGRVADNAGFAYSDAMREHAAEAPTWTYDELNEFIASPQRHVPGTKMSFAGIKNTDERVALIAWLRQQGSGGYAVPAPDPARQPGAAAPAEGEAGGEGEAATTAMPDEAEDASAQAGGPAGQGPAELTPDQSRPVPGKAEPH